LRENRSNREFRNSANEREFQVFQYLAPGQLKFQVFRTGESASAREKRRIGSKKRKKRNIKKIKEMKKQSQRSGAIRTTGVLSLAAKYRCNCPVGIGPRVPTLSKKSAAWITQSRAVTFDRGPEAPRFPRDVQSNLRSIWPRSNIPPHGTDALDFPALPLPFDRNRVRLHGQWAEGQDGSTYPLAKARRR
jgi:hypothetical protein